ncbi:MAG: M23 family peptidase, partial [Bradyrhizobium sp.]
MGGTAVRFVKRSLAILGLLLAGTAAATGEEFRAPVISVVHVEWHAVLDQLRAEINAAPAIASDFAFSPQRRVGAFDPRSMPALVQLNAVTSPVFSGIGRSPVPVLLPFDTASYLEARQNGHQPGLPLSHYQADFRAVDLFDAGPAGYDAVFSLDPDAGAGLPQRTFARPVEVQITGSLLTYDVADPQGGKGEPVKSLAAQYPDLRRFIREGYVRYAFTRFGVPYVVSIQCLDSAPRARRLACREAYPVAERFLKALRIAGGLPARPRPDISSETADRPLVRSPDFTYRPP